MLTIISAVIGFLSSALPDIIKLFQDKNTNNNQVQIMQLQVQMMQENNESMIEQLKKIQEMQNSHDVYVNALNDKTSSKFINALRASVRPILTYLFFALFAFIKVCAIIKMMHDGASLPDAFLAMWDEQTQMLFSVVVAFWFGQRAIQKIRET